MAFGPDFVELRALYKAEIVVIHEVRDMVVFDELYDMIELGIFVASFRGAHLANLYQGVDDAFFPF